jgi:hypothetical protein
LPTVNFSLLSVTCTILPSCCSVPITVSCLGFLQVQGLGSRLQTNV